MRKQAIISITLLMVAVSAHALDRSARLTRQIFFRFTRASQTYVAERNGSVSNEEAIGHRITFAGISGCDINLKRIAGSNGVGLSQTWNATAVGNGCPPDPVYQFSLAQDGPTEFAMKRDFATKGSAVDSLMRTNWTWTPMTPGEYQVRVVLKATYGSPDRDRLEAVSHPVSIPRPILDAARPSGHPLVAVYTTDQHRCQMLQVRFRESGASDPATWQLTNSLPCKGDLKTFFLAGMKAVTTYDVELVVDGNPLHKAVTFTTQAIPPNVHINETSTNSLRDPLNLVRATDALADTTMSFHWDVFNRPVWNGDPLIGTPIFKTIAEQPVWYWHLQTAAPELNIPIVPRKTELEFLGFARDENSPPGSLNASLTVYRELDLASMPLWETNLRALDQRANVRQFGFHHDALRMVSPRGNARRLLITYTARCKHPNVSPNVPDDPGDDPDVSSDWVPVCPCTRQGCDPTRTQTWLGDGLLLVRDDGSIAWQWSIFDRLPTNRPSPTDYPVCTVANGECPLLGAREYTHSNAISLSEDRSVLLLSSRYQDWVIAIDFKDGNGTGRVLWRLGRGGSFPCTTDNGDPCPTFDPPEEALGQPPQSDPWFSHQHTAHFLGADRILLFDNGNVRCAATGATADWVCNSNGIRSRVQLYRLQFDRNGAPLRAVRERNAVLVRYSSAFGTAQLFSNNNLVGALGNIPTDSTATAPRVSYVEEIAVDPHTLLPVQTYTYIAREPPGDPVSVGGRTLRAQRAPSLYSNSPAP